MPVGCVSQKWCSSYSHTTQSVLESPWTSCRVRGQQDEAAGSGRAGLLDIPLGWGTSKALGKEGRMATISEPNNTFSGTLGVSLVLCTTGCELGRAE